MDEFFRNAWEANKDHLYNFILRSIGMHRHNDALDILQDTAVAAWQGLDKLKNRDVIYQWFRGIAINQIKMFYRKNRYYYELDIKKLDAYLMDNLLNQDEENVIVEKMYLWDFISKLPPVFQNTLRMRYIDDLSIATIAKITGVPISTLKSRLKRAESILAKEIKNEAE